MSDVPSPLSPSSQHVLLLSKVPHSDLAPPGVSAQNSAAAPEMDDEVHGAMEMETTPATLAYTITIAITFLCYPGQAPLPSRVS